MGRITVTHTFISGFLVIIFLLAIPLIICNAVSIFFSISILWSPVFIIIFISVRFFYYFVLYFYVYLFFSPVIFSWSSCRSIAVGHSLYDYVMSKRCFQYGYVLQLSISAVQILYLSWALIYNVVYEYYEERFNLLPCLSSCRLVNGSLYRFF